MTPRKGKYGEPWRLKQKTMEIVTNDGPEISPSRGRMNLVRMVKCVNAFDGLNPDDWTRILTYDPEQVARLLEAVDKINAHNAEREATHISKLDLWSWCDERDRLEAVAVAIMREMGAGDE